MADVYAMLAEKLSDELGPTEMNSWKDIVEYLENNGFIDYDNLKEIFLYGEEE